MINIEEITICTSGDSYVLAWNSEICCIGVSDVRDMNNAGCNLSKEELGALIHKMTKVYDRM